MENTQKVPWCQAVIQQIELLADECSRSWGVANTSLIPQAGVLASIILATDLTSNECSLLIEPWKILEEHFRNRKWGVVEHLEVKIKEAAESEHSRNR